MTGREDHTAFAADVRRDLLRTPKQLQPRYFYDDLGSSLFEAICRLPWYRISRSELALLEAHAEQIVSACRAGTVVELGCGHGEKIERLAAPLAGAGTAVRFHLVDLSAQALEETAARLSRLGFTAGTHRATFERGLELAVAQGSGAEPVLVLFLGSNVGNFNPVEADTLLRGIRERLRPGDLLLLGADLTKPEPELILAYDDPLGVTAAFNKNVLVRINRELSGDFDLAAFEHRAVWNAAEARVEMHLVSTRAQRIRVPAADLTVDMARGESIWTESAYKYEPAAVVAMGEQAGFTRLHQWIDPAARFSLTLFGVTR